MLEVLPLALQYGMSANDFWHKDKRLYKAYEKAYYTRLYETAWINGLYVDIALENLAGNMFAKKGAKRLAYPNKPINPFEKKTVLTASDAEKRYRESIYKLDWLKKEIKKER